jgi:hypothetical protein
MVDMDEVATVRGQPESLPFVRYRDLQARYRAQPDSLHLWMSCAFMRTVAGRIWARWPPARGQPESLPFNDPLTIMVHLAGSAPEPDSLHL